MSSIGHLYTSLIESLVQQQHKFKEKKLSIFSASAGTTYNGKLMVLGRAVNDWEPYLNPSSEESVEQCLLAIHEAIGKENLDWGKEKWGLHEGYNTNKSAFWRLSRKIAEKISPDTEFHTDKIVWSNLYKAAKCKKDEHNADKKFRGNPSSRLMKAQFESCKDILNAEIDLYKPAYIVFLTGLGWARHFLTDATQISNNADWRYVEQIGSYRGCQYVVGQHPQGKNEALHLQEILKHIS